MDEKNNELETLRSWDDVAAERASAHFFPVLFLSRTDLAALGFSAAAVQIRSNQSLNVHEPQMNPQLYYKTGVSDTRDFDLLCQKVKAMFEDPKTSSFGVFVLSEVFLKKKKNV